MTMLKSTAIMSGVGATALIVAFCGRGTEAMQQHRAHVHTHAIEQNHRSIMSHVHTHGHSHPFVYEKEGLNKAVHDQWALQQMLKQHQKSEGSGKGAEKDISRHMHKPISGNAG